MAISIGTFNLNNLFSRFNFSAELDELPPGQAGGMQITFTPEDVRVRTFMGRLVRRKGPGETADIARRILAMDLDVLAVQEVEHIEILREFNRDYLGGLYRYIALLEGNDPRLIDVGLLSKLRIGAIVSHQTAEHPERPGERVFGRDLMQAEILDDGGAKLLTVYNTHLKSHYVPPGEDQVEGARRANARRRPQAEVTAAILTARERKGGRFVVVGDMNDPPGSEALAPMLEVDGGILANGLAAAAETRPSKPESPGQGAGPAHPVWTHRFNPAGTEPPRYELFDQVWLSPGLAPRLMSAHIERRSKHGGDGSDHDPAWVVLDL